MTIQQNDTEKTTLEGLAALAGHSAGTPIYPALVNLEALGATVDQWGLEEVSSPWLNQAEQAVLNGFRLRKRWLEWLGGRICAKKVALASLTWNRVTAPPMPPQLWIRNQASGRPFLELDADHSKVHSQGNSPLADLSISHSGLYATALAARSFCGIDIQQISQALERTQERFATPAEMAVLKDIWPACSKRERLGLLWSAKEALKKAMGQEQMPGFLELILDTTQPQTAGSLRDPVLCSFRRCNVSHPPHVQPLSLPQVAVTLLNRDYALALCAQSPNNDQPSDHA